MAKKTSKKKTAKKKTTKKKAAKKAKTAAPKARKRVVAPAASSGRGFTKGPGGLSFGPSTGAHTLGRGGGQR